MEDKRSPYSCRLASQTRRDEREREGAVEGSPREEERGGESKSDTGMEGVNGEAEGERGKVERGEKGKEREGETGSKGETERDVEERWRYRQREREKQRKTTQPPTDSLGIFPITHTHTHLPGSCLSQLFTCTM